MNILIKGGLVVDPKNNLEKVADLLIENKKIAKVQEKISEAPGLKVVEAQGKVVMPGLIDMHAHLRQPGREDEETLLSGAQAAVKGGFTTVLCMPNTDPVIDNVSLARWVVEESQRLGLCGIIPVGAMTKGQEGKEISEFADLKSAGCLAVSDDGKSVGNPQIMRRALEYASMAGLLVISHCEDPHLSQQGMMNESRYSTALGLKGIPDIAEAIFVARDLELARFTQAKIHLAHLSCQRSLVFLRRAKEEGVRVSAETCPHYFTLTEDALLGYDTNLKINPPLRSEDDREALRRGLSDGTIDCIATDHAPHALFEKELEFDRAPCGTVGLETALALAYGELVASNVLDWNGLVERMSLSPATILGLNKGSFSEGSDADVTIFDPERLWDVTVDALVSKSKNSAFLGRKLKGVVEQTIREGKIVYRNDALR